MIKGVFIINNHGKPRLIKDFQRMVSCLSPIGITNCRCELDDSSIPGVCHMFLPSMSLQTQADQQQTIREIFSLLAKRSDNVCNFLEGGR